MMCFKMGLFVIKAIMTVTTRTMNGLKFLAINKTNCKDQGKMLRK